MPLFTIITVTYNAAETIQGTLDSVAAQTHDSFEHLIIDGASTDATVEIARRNAPENRIVSSAPDRGLYDAMNKGIDRAKGEYLIFLNAGDRFHSPHTLSHLAQKIMDNDFPGVVYGQTDIVDASGRRLGARHLQAPANLTYESFKGGMVVCHQSFVVLARIVEYYDLRYRFSADYEWCIRVLQHSRNNVYLDEVVCDYLSDGTTTRHRRASLGERFRIMSYYYGFWPTLGRHLRFIPRFLKRRRQERGFKS